MSSPITPELIDFPDSIPYSPIGVAPSDRAEIPRTLCDERIPEMTAPEISHQLLAGVADSVEARNRTRGGFNQFVVRYAGNACKLFGFTNEARRFEALLGTLTPQSYWAGAITNIDMSIPPGATELSAIAKIEGFFEKTSGLG